MASEVRVRFSADVAEFISAFEAADEATRTSAEFTKKYKTAIKSLGSAFDGLRVQLDPAIAAARNHASALQLSQSAAALGIITEKELTETVRKLGEMQTEHTSILSQNRMGLMEVGHSARSMADGLAAGIPPSRLLAMEGARLVQAFAEMSPAMMGIVAAGLAVAGTFGLIFTKATEMRTALGEISTAKGRLGESGGWNPQAEAAAIDALAEKYHLFRSQAIAVAEATAKIGGLTHDQVPKVEALIFAEAKLDKTLNGDFTKAGDKVVQMFQDNGSAALKYADSLQALDGAQHRSAAEALASMDVVAARNVALDALNNRQLPQAINMMDKYTQSLTNWNAIMTAAAGGVASPEMLGYKPQENPEGPDPGLGTPAQSPQERQTAAIENEKNEPLDKRKGLLAQIELLQKAVNAAEAEGANATNEQDALKATDDLVAATNALATAKLDVAKVHTAPETDAYERQLQLVRQLAAEAPAGSQKRVDAARQEAEAIRQYLATPYNDNGQQTQQYIEAINRVKTAEREASEEGLRAHAAAERAKVEATVNGSAERLAAEKRILAEIAAIHPAGSSQYEAQNQKVEAAEHAHQDLLLALKIGGIRERQAADKDDLAKQIQEQDEILGAISAAGRQGTQEYVAEETRRAELVRAQRDKLFDDQSVKLRDQVKDESISADAKIALVTAYVQRIAAQYTEASTQFKRAKQLELDVTKQIEAEKRAEQAKSIDDQIRLLDRQQQATERALASQVATKQITEAQGTAATIAAVTAQYAAELRLLQQRLAIDGLAAKDKAATEDKIAALDDRYNAQMLQAAEQLSNKTSEAWQSTLGPIDSAFQSAMTGIVEHTETASQAMAKIGNAIVSTFVSTGVKIATDWLKEQLLMTTETEAQAAARNLIQVAANTKDQAAIAAAVARFTGAEASKTAASGTGAASREAIGAGESNSLFGQIGQMLARWLGLETGKTVAAEAQVPAQTAANAAVNAEDVASGFSQIQVAAAVAAANAYASAAAMPAAAAALATAAWGVTMGFASGLGSGAIASAAGGWGRIPSDQLAMVHQDEMVLPASIASPLRAALAAGQNIGGGVTGAAQSTGGGGASNGGTVQMTYAPVIQSMDASGVDAVLSNHSSTIISFFQNALRNGALRAS